MVPAISIILFDLRLSKTELNEYLDMGKFYLSIKKEKLKMFIEEFLRGFSFE